MGYRVPIRTSALNPHWVNDFLGATLRFSTDNWWLKIMTRWYILILLYILISFLLQVFFLEQKWRKKIVKLQFFVSDDYDDNAGVVRKVFWITVWKFPDFFTSQIFREIKLSINTYKIAQNYWKNFLNFIKIDFT